MSKPKTKLADPTRTIEKYVERDNTFKSVKLIPLKEEWLKAKGIDEKVKIIGKVLGLED